MDDQYELIHGSDFSTLIILDACRFDYFKKQNKIPGELKEVKSRAFHTWDWLQANFPDEYDWTYFTAHPYVNLGSTQKWNAIQHFNKIVPIWRFGWNNTLGTVHPKTVNTTVKNIPYEKAIIHYVQPHGPWIGKKYRWVDPWTLADYSHHQVMGDWRAVMTKPDPTFFRLCYRDNLDLVLGYVEKLLPYLKPPVVITADHGELLGEKGMYLHGAVKKSELHLPYPEWAVEFLKHVPWLTVDE